jgi:hypothetical protein
LLEWAIANAVGDTLTIPIFDGDAASRRPCSSRTPPISPGRTAATTRTGARFATATRTVASPSADAPCRCARRGCAVDGSGELSLESYELFASTELLGRLAMEKMLAKISTRRHLAGLEPVGKKVEAIARSSSKSAVSRRFVEATEQALSDLPESDLSNLDLVALMIDGVHFADHLCLVALGIDLDGRKHPLAVVEGSSENTTVVTTLLTGLRERGLDTTRPILVVIDGAKALAAGVKAVFDRSVIQRVPDTLRASRTWQLRRVYRRLASTAPRHPSSC